MVETTFLVSVENYLQALTLSPLPQLVGAAEPAAAGDLPAIVLSLETCERPGTGLGERSALVTGALPWQAAIDLANPVLPEEPTFVLLDPTRTRLILPHGGLVKSDGSDPGAAPLEPADITVSVAGLPRTVVATAPDATQVRADPLTGELTFGGPLPASGFVAVTYFIGQWEQRLERADGVMVVDTCATTGDDARTLSDSVIGALLSTHARKQIVRLHAISLASVSSIAAPVQGAPTTLRRRTARFAFRFEAEINRPESSGGVIRRIPVTSDMGDGLRPPGVLAGSSEDFTIPA